MSDAGPQHFWNDPDNDGHDCIDCMPGSIWRCDKAAHPTRPMLTAAMKKALAAFSHARRGTTPRPGGLA